MILCILLLYSVINFQILYSFITLKKCDHLVNYTMILVSPNEQHKLLQTYKTSFTYLVTYKKCFICNNNI